MQHVPEAFAKDFQRLAHDTKLARSGPFRSDGGRQTISFAPDARRRSTQDDNIAVDLYCCGYMEKVSSTHCVISHDAGILRPCDPPFGVICFCRLEASENRGIGAGLNLTKYI